MAGRNNVLIGNITKLRFNFFLIVFRTAGIPILFEKVPKLFQIYCFAVNTCVFIFYASNVLDLFTHKEDLRYTMETVRAAAPASTIIWTYSFLRFRTNVLERLIRGTEAFNWETLPKNDPDTGSLTMAGWISVIKTTIKRITISAELYLVAYIIACSVISDKRIPLFNAWFPCDMALSPAYELINIQQSIAAASYVFTVYPFPCFFATLVCITGSQLEKLRARLLNIKLKRDTAMQQESGAETDHEEVFRHMQKELNECVRQHQEILRYIRELEDSLNVFMTGVFLLSLISMCLCAFSIVTSWGDHFMMLQGVIAYSMALVPLVFYCWFGYELTAQTQRIKDAAWGCDWVGTPVSFQKSIRLIISSANKELTLTAGKIVPVTISTMVNMVNQSVSYFMFLLEVKDSIETDE